MTSKPERFIPAWGWGETEFTHEATSDEEFLTALKNDFIESIAMFFDLNDSPDREVPEQWHKKTQLLQATDFMFDALRKIVHESPRPLNREAVKILVQNAGDVAAIASLFNFYTGETLLSDTWVELQTKGEVVSKQRAEEIVEQRLQEQRKYLPNRVYTQDMFFFFEREYQKCKLQYDAFLATAKKFRLKPLKYESFLVQYRKFRLDRK